MVLPPQGRKPLLLGVRVDVGADNEPDNVEERYPGLLRKELLRKGKRNWRRDPGYFHNRHKTRTDSGPDLMEGPRSGYDGHRDKVHRVLDRRDLK